MFDVGVPELILVLVVALVVFGPGKLPEIGASLGKAIRDFRGATQAISNEVNAVKNFDILAEDEATTKRIMAEKAQTETASTAPAAGTETAAIAPDASTEAPAAAPAASAEAPGDQPAAPAQSLTPMEQIQQLEASIAMQESLRSTMGDPSTDAIIATIRARIEAIQRDAPPAQPETAAEPAAVAA